MTWKVKAESMCGECSSGMAEGCIRTGIPDAMIFMHMVSGIKMAFVHDCAECGGMCEVEEELAP